MANPGSDAELYDKLAAFLASDQATPMKLDLLYRLLTMNPEREPTKPLLSIEEAEERLICMHKLAMCWKRSFSELTGCPEKDYRPLPQIAIATMMTIDLKRLQNFTFDTRITQINLKDLFVMPCLVKAVVFGCSYDNENKKPEVTRDEKEKEERARLDGNRCVILRSGSPQVCHIVPFIATTKEVSKMAKYLPPAIPCMFNNPPGYKKTLDLNNRDPEAWIDPVEKLELKCCEIFASKPGISDKAWNQISLDYQLHAWWTQGYLAFEPLGIEHKEGLSQIKIQFHWMPRRKDYGSEAPPLTTDKTSQGREVLESMLSKTYGHFDPANPVFAPDERLSHYDQLQTGDIYYVKVETQHADHMLTAFKLRWAVSKIYSIAGGVEALKDVGDHPEYLDENLEWIGRPEPSFRELMEEAYRI